MSSRFLSRPLLLATSVVLALLFLAGSAAATPIADKKARAQQIRAEVAALDQRFEVVVEQYNAANAKLDTVRGQIRENTRLLRIARFNLQVATHNLSARAVALYKQQPVDVLDVLLQTGSFEELASQVELMNRLGQHDVDIIASVQRYKRTVTRKRGTLMTDRQEAQKLVAQITKKKGTIEATLVTRREMLRGVEAEVRRLEQQEAERARRVVAAAAASASETSSNQRPIIPDAAGPGHPEVCAIAARYLGIPYLYGGASPTTGFDCSGFVMYVYAQIGISLPHYSGSQQQMGTSVSMNALLPGDLVFRGYPAYHVGIYVGSGMVIHSPHTGAVVSYQSVSGWTSAVRL